MYPSLASINAVCPPRAQAEVIITYCLSSLGWLFSVIHAPIFMTEFVTFWSKGARALETTSPSWLALYFGLLTCGVTLLTAELRLLLGLSTGKPTDWPRLRHISQ